MAEKKQLTVGDVLAVLKTLDQDKPVWVEGCDCIRELLEVAVVVEDHPHYRGSVLMYTDGHYGDAMLGRESD